jgi:hypothetical protein
MQRMPGNPRSGEMVGHLRPRQAFGHSPCRNQRVPCKELALATQEYDSGGNAAWH